MGLHTSGGESLAPTGRPTGMWLIHARGTAAFSCQITAHVSLRRTNHFWPEDFLEWEIASCAPFFDACLAALVGTLSLDTIPQTLRNI